MGFPYSTHNSTGAFFVFINTGGYRVLDALHTLGFHYPRRGKFFREQLSHFLRFAREEKLAPTKPLHPFGTKRPSLEQDFYDVFNQPNVELIDLREHGIEEITASGVQTAGGHHALDPEVQHSRPLAQQSPQNAEDQR